MSLRAECLVSLSISLYCFHSWFFKRSDLVCIHLILIFFLFSILFHVFSVAIVHGASFGTQLSFPQFVHSSWNRRYVFNESQQHFAELPL